MVIAMAKYYTPFSLRISEELLGKVKYIAAMNKRSANKEVEYMLARYVSEYEETFGRIENIDMEKFMLTTK